MFEYRTQVKIDINKLKGIVEELRLNYLEVNTRETHEGRSRFSQWNNINKFLERITTGEIPSKVSGVNSQYRIFDVVGSAKGNSARVYFKPSITSLAKPIRKCIVPVNEESVFAFFDLRAAEFAMNAIFAQESEAVDAYHNGEDIYLHYRNLFPQDADRKVIKKILIANMYNKSAYSTAIDLGCSEAQAQRLLDQVAQQIPRMTMLKRKIYSYDRRYNGYFAPKGFDQTNLVKVADIDPTKGFNPDFALSAYTQSALGLFMQELTNKLTPRINGTLISVFDSMCVEIRPESKERFESWVRKSFSPLVPDKITYGTSFYEAAYGI